jgi:hypothetical protein
MKRIGAFVMCDKCAENEFGNVEGIDCNTDAYDRTYAKWLKEYKKG